MGGGRRERWEGESINMVSAAAIHGNVVPASISSACKIKI